MKNALLLLSLAAAAVGSPVTNIFSYVSEDGNQLHEASGDPGVDVQGRAMWDADGKTYAFTYNANDMGYVPDDAETRHFPVSVGHDYLPYADDVAKARAEHLLARKQVVAHLNAAAAKLEGGSPDEGPSLEGRRRRDAGDEENVVFSYSDPDTKQSHYMKGIPGVAVTGGWTFTPEDMEYKLTYRANADDGFLPEANYLPMPVPNSYLPNTPEVDAYIADWANHIPQPVENSYLPNAADVDAYISDWGNHIPVSVPESYLPDEAAVAEARAAHLKAWNEAKAKHLMALEAAAAEEEEVVERKKRQVVLEQNSPPLYYIPQHYQPLYYIPHYIVPLAPPAVAPVAKVADADADADAEAEPEPMAAEPMTPGDTKILDPLNPLNQAPGAGTQFVRRPLIYQPLVYYPTYFNQAVIPQSPVNIGVPNEEEAAAELMPAPESSLVRIQAAEVLK